MFSEQENTYSTGIYIFNKHKKNAYIKGLTSLENSDCFQLLLISICQNRDKLLCR